MFLTASSTFFEYAVIALFALQTGDQTPDIVNDQIITTLNTKKLSGLGFFGGNMYDFSPSYCNSATNNIDDFINPDKFHVKEIPITITSLRKYSKPRLSYNISNLNNQTIPINANTILSFSISNIGENNSFLDVTDISFTGIKNTIKDSSFII